MKHYIKTGIIESSFPSHKFRTRENIKVNWDKEKKEVFFDPWKFKSSRKDLRPFNSMAFFYGCDIALYLSFTTLITSYLLALTLIGIIFYVTALIV